MVTAVPWFLELHCLDRMRTRNITRDEIEEALTNPETTYRSEDYPDERIVILGRTLAGRRLKVVVDADDTQHVWTACDRDEE